MRMNIPVGISDFEQIRSKGYYYIDKSGMIAEILKSESTAVTLITRPRRFGKTLGMSMLSSFFDIRTDSRELFQGLEISKDTELCRRWQNQYPAIFLSFKDVDGLTFESAYEMLSATITDLYKKHLYLLDSAQINAYDKEIMHQIIEGRASVTEIKKSLALLITAMRQHYGRQVILLLDEYDVPVAKASSHGYYAQMMEVIKALMSTTLKDNASLQFAVLTGCLKIAKESIFTGTNNFVSDTITSSHLNEYFGFTDSEVDQLYEKYTRNTREIHISREDLKEWYDGYTTKSGERMYNPRSVVLALTNNNIGNYWTSSGPYDEIFYYIRQNIDDVQNDLALMISGETVTAKIQEYAAVSMNLTTKNEIFSAMIVYGFLSYENGKVRIPNKELMNKFDDMIQG